MDNKLTLAVKEYAYSLGADLVGIANIERYKDAPIKMSPQGILPTAKSVVVCAIHHPDAAIELDGEVHPQIMGPYVVQLSMNNKLDVMSFKIGRMLDDLGYKTVPIASSNIWRYRGYKEMDAVFAPDISHIYSAVCAGLGELGWNGLCMTPEYGTRNRFVSIITEAELTPTPLYNGPKLCDMCGECIRNCPTNAYRDEVNGVKDVVVEGKHHKFANKNLWRCAWGEHFGLDLDLPIPEKVDEQVLLDNVRDHGRRGGEFGVCLKVCLPAYLRQWDKSYCQKTARRKRQAIPNTELPMHRQLYGKILVHARRWDMDSVHFLSAKALADAGISIREALPDGVSAIVLSCICPEAAQGIPANNPMQIAQFGLDFAELDICRELETVGYSALPRTYMKHEPFRKLTGIDGENVKTAVILTSASVEDRAYTGLNTVDVHGDLRTTLFDLAKDRGIDLMGVAAADTIACQADGLQELRADEKLFAARDKNIYFRPYLPEVSVGKRVIRKPEDYVPGAKSVIVLGMHYPETAALRVGQPPAECVGPYVFEQYEVNRLIGHAAYSVVKALEGLGYHAKYTFNLTGAGGVVGSPRGEFADSMCNTLEAACAGIGKMTLNGSLDTKEFGIHQRFIAIVTDAQLPADPVQEGMSEACAGCGACLKACPTCALCQKKVVELDVGGAKIGYLPVDANRCNWATQFALVAEEGNMYCGNFTNLPYPEDGLTEEKLADALSQQDHVFKFRPVMGERCVVVCPLVK